MRERRRADGPVRPSPRGGNPSRSPKNHRGRSIRQHRVSPDVLRCPRNGPDSRAEAIEILDARHPPAGVCFSPSIHTSPSPIVHRFARQSHQPVQNGTVGSSGVWKTITSQRRGLRHLLTMNRSPMCSTRGGLATSHDLKLLAANHHGRVIRWGLAPSLNRAIGGTAATWTWRFPMCPRMVGAIEFAGIRGRFKTKARAEQRTTPPTSRQRHAAGISV